MLIKKPSLNTILIILAIIAGIQVIGLFCSPTPPPQQNDKNSAYQKNDTAGPAIFLPIFNNTKRGIYCVVDWIDINNDIVIALATIVIGFFTFTLWRATSGMLKVAQDQSRDMKASIAVAKEAADAAKDSAQIGRETLESTQRAFISLKEIIVKKVLDPKKRKVVAWRFFAEIENSGSTPAVNLLNNISRKISESPEVPLSQEYIFTVEPKPSDLGPRATIDIGPLDIPIDIIMAVQNHTKHLYIYGLIVYEDILKNTPSHTTRFCREIFGIGGNPSDPNPGTEIMFISHPTYDDKNQK